jgi:hypothetical protein
MTIIVARVGLWFVLGDLLPQRLRLQLCGLAVQWLRRNTSIRSIVSQSVLNIGAPDRRDDIRWQVAVLQ